MEDMFVMFAQEDFGGGAGAAGGLFGMLCFLGVAFAVMGALLYGVFKKADVTPWWAFIPILNAVGLLQVARKPIWWIILFMIPIVSIVVAILVAIEIAKKFGGGVGTVVGLVLIPFIFYPVLGYGSATYDGSRTELAT